MRSLVLGLLLLSSTAFANILGTHFQNFNPTTNGLDFVTVHSSRTLDPGMVNFGAWMDYSVNSMPYFQLAGAPGATFSEPDNKLLASSLNLGLGLMKGWDVGISLPFILDQDEDSNANLGTFDENGLAEIRLNSKYRFWENDSWAAAIVGGINFDRIKNNPFTGSDSGPTFNLEGAIDHKLSNGWLWALNLGYRLRDQGDTIPNSGVTPYPDQIIFSSALAIPYERWDTTFIFEAYGTTLTEDIDTPTDRETNSLELLAGAKYMATPNMAVNAGVTFGAYRGLATPDYRIYAGLNWLIGPVWGTNYQEPAPVVQEAPKPEPVVEEKPSETIILSSINFATASADMTAASRAAFQKTAEQLKNSKTIRKIIVEGHTDNVGKDAYNQKLSEGRARSVQKILQTAMPQLSSQIQAVGLGENRPVATNDSVDGRAQNRRVEIKIYRNE